jgi:DNA repair ATPase RecN
MGRPPGSPNKMTKERDEATKKLAKKYGSPLERILKMQDRWQKIYDELLAKPYLGSRLRSKLNKAEAMIRQYSIDAMPYMETRYKPIEHVSDERTATGHNAPRGGFQFASMD